MAKWRVTVRMVVPDDMEHGEVERWVMSRLNVYSQMSIVYPMRHSDSDTKAWSVRAKKEEEENHGQV